MSISIFDFDPNDERAEPIVHIVRPGETLRTLALHYFDDQEAWRAIVSVNRIVVGLDGELHPGQRLMIPVPRGDQGDGGAGDRRISERRSGDRR